MSKYFILILVTVALNATSQLLMKAGTNRVQQVTAANAGSFLMSVATQPLIIFGLVSMTISMVVYLMALSRFDVSFAFPFLSIGYVIVALYGYFFFGESMSLYKILGITTIVAGTILIYHS